MLLHGLTGAAVAALSGGDSGAAAAGAAGAELAKDAMIRYLAGQGLDPRSGEFNTLIELASTALGGALGGADGAGTAQLGDRFNRQMHWDQYLEELDSCSSNPGGAGCSAILGMTADTQAVVISDSSEAARYKVIANQSKSTGETVSFTLTEPDGTPRIIMNKDEYNQFVASGMPPFMLGMSPGYGLDYGSALMHVFKGDVKEGIGDLKNVFTSGEYWRDMGLAMITGAAGVGPPSKFPGTVGTSVGAKTTGSGAKFADHAKLDDHFARHGSDFGAKNTLEYQAQADKFLTALKPAGVLEKARPNGDIVRYNPSTDEFGVVSSGGSIRTYYKPDPAVHGKGSNLEYFNAQ